jgi:signal transduction histidine kinase
MNFTAEKENTTCLYVLKTRPIHESIERKIFEPRFTTKTSGMGLGLPMIKNIIETYNGSISFSTLIGEGSEFTVQFPKHS